MAAWAADADELRLTTVLERAALLAGLQRIWVLEQHDRAFLLVAPRRGRRATALVALPPAVSGTRHLDRVSARDNDAGVERAGQNRQHVVINEFKVHLDDLVESQEVANDRDNVGNVHYEDGGAAAELARTLRAPQHDPPQVDHREKATEKAQEAVDNVHHKTHKLVQSLNCRYAKVHVTAVVTLGHAVGATIALSQVRHEEAASVTDSHVYGVEDEVGKDVSELDPNKGLHDTYHACYSHHGGRHLGDAPEGTAEELGQLVDEGVGELNLAQEDVSHEDGRDEVRQEVR